MKVATMLNQTFTAKQFKDVFKKKDFLSLRTTNPNANIDEIYQEAEVKFKEIKQNRTSLENFYETVINGCNVFVPINLIDQYLIRKLDRNLTKIQKPKYSNRNIIINNIKLILTENYKYKILKLDIQSMYENIGWDDCITHTLKTSKIIDNNNFLLLDNIKETMANQTGVATENVSLIRGLSTSALLSDLYMRKLDRFIKEHQNVYYYARYVDDIIIFMFQECDVLELKIEIQQELDKLGLEFNQDKTQIIVDQGVYSFDYLGYTFTLQGKKLTTSISQKKITKVKRKFFKVFADFAKTYESNPEQSLQLLRQRIKFITCTQVFKIKNYGVHKTVYNSFINHYYYADEEQKTKALQELDLNLEYYLNKHKDKPRMKKNRYFNFFHAQQNKIKIKYSVNLIKKIRRCWYYG